MKLLTEKQLIKHWAKHVNQFMLESNIRNIFDKVEWYFDEYVSDNNYKYFIGLRKSSKTKIKTGYKLFYTANTIDDIEDIINDKFSLEVILRIANILSKNKNICKKLDITYYDHPHSEDSFIGEAVFLYDDIEFDLKYNIGDELDNVLKNPRKYTVRFNNNVFTTILGSGEIPYIDYKIVFGITNYKNKK